MSQFADVQISVRKGSRAPFFPEMVAVGLRLRDLREAKGFSLEYVAEKSDVSISTVSRHERALVSGNVSAIRRIAEVLEAPVSYFHGEPSELEALTPDQVAARTSVNLFLQAHPELSREERTACLDASRNREAPKNFEAWERIGRIVRSVQGGFQARRT